MVISPKNLAKHEIIGCFAKVTKSADPSKLGLCGKVVDETRNTLTILDSDGTERVVPKAESVFHINIGSATVSVDGKLLIGRPEERIKKRVKKW